MAACCELCLGNVPEGATLCPRCELPFLAGKAAGLVEAEAGRQRLAHQRAILRREVRRLNEKVAAMSTTIHWRLGAGKQLSHEIDRRLLDGPAMWDLRQALGLEACEVSNADVIRAAARRLGKREVK